MQRMDRVGFAIVMTVHDEIVMEASPGVSVEVVCQMMAETPPWAEGLVLRADGFACQFYKKE